MKTLDDNVVPRSSKKFNVQDKDGNVCWRLVAFRKSMDVIIHKGHANKIVIKEFNFNSEQADISNSNKRELQILFEEKKKILWGTSMAAFSELFICLAHLKVSLKAFRR